MKSLPTRTIFLIWIASILGIVLVIHLAARHVHGQDIVKEIPKFFVVELDEQGNKHWVSIELPVDAHMYCDAGPEVYTPCKVVRWSSEEGLLILGPAPINGKPFQKPASMTTPLTQAENQ